MGTAFTSLVSLHKEMKEKIEDLSSNGRILVEELPKDEDDLNAPSTFPEFCHHIA